MTISATVQNSSHQHHVTVSTEGNAKVISIPAKSAGFGSSVNGGELLFLSLATCFCNDLYREAPRRNITIQSIDVTVTGQFGAEGEPGSNIAYSVKVDAPSATPEEIANLIRHVDQIAEIHNTLRKGVSVSLEQNVEKK